ncbi:sensor histidine kinase [Nocardioides sp.]|uniref:sensor histidine kinase n=1 Tax=Nocardioides sp. TaxID=35761 RepID=UPI002B278A9E|nr:ATP-binding protein [Nocardioides sp.]
MTRRPTTLTSRLVLTTVLLVVCASVVLAGLTAVVMRTYLSDRLDDDVDRALARQSTVGPGGPLGDGQRPRDGGPRADEVVGGQEIGTVSAAFTGDVRFGRVLAEADKIGADLQPLDAAVLDALNELPVDGEPRSVDLPGLGSYRVAGRTQTDGSVVVAGLPTAEVDDAITLLVLAELLLLTVAAALAALAGRTVVRRQLRPLREVAGTAHSVAGLPLDSGTIGVTERVPAHLTDERTEVGQVGSALNTLLAHVEGSLDARHASEQRVRQFVADASHELRTPLTTIAGYTELARRRPDDAAASAMALAKVEEESARMTRLVEDLLLLARLDSGRPLERETVDLSRLLMEAVSDARVLAPEHRWRLELPEDAVEITGDDHRLHQVVTNLLTNARKYTPAGTTVTVTARPDGFTVHDDGPGFAPEIAAHAFERFARADVGRHREGGVGLGLALVEAIVASHGGSVTLTSEPGDTRIDVHLA